MNKPPYKKNIVNRRPAPYYSREFDKLKNEEPTIRSKVLLQIAYNLGWKACQETIKINADSRDTRISL